MHVGVADIFDICNFYRLCILPISWRDQRILKPRKTFDL
jgi:hypothetical protein